MLKIENQNKFGKIIADALAKVELTVTDAQNKRRWINAISKAVVQIEDHSEFMTWQEDSKSLLIWSQDSNDIHAANGVCDCEAYKRGFPCWHRAAARLVRLYMEARLEANDNIPFIKNNVYTKAERVGGVRIN